MIAIIALVAVVAGVGAYLAVNQLKPSPEISLSPANSSKPIGAVDEAVNTVLQDSASEQALIGNEDSEASLIKSDDQLISDLGQSYNESEF